MESLRKKPGLALVVSVGKEKHADPDEKDETGDGALDEASYNAAVGELAEALGVDNTKVDDFASAFKAAVMACME